MQNFSGYTSMVTLDKLWEQERLKADLYNKITTRVKTFTIDEAEHIKKDNVIEKYTFATLDYKTMWLDVYLYLVSEEDGKKILSVIN